MIISCFLLLLAASFLSAGLVLQPQNRIVGGKDMDIEEAPWQVSLQVNGEHHCGGSIYSDRIIITAAHCFYKEIIYMIYRPLLAKEILVIAGSEFKRPRKILAAVSAIKHFEKFVMDPKLNLNTYDIGIMKLSKPLPVSNQIRPIPLAVENPAPGSVALSTGWGRIFRLDIADISPEILQGINISIGNFDWCKKSLGLMTKDTICAGTAGHSSCRGDSGGPLVFNNTLVGVVSGGTKLCVGPGIYTSVAHYHNWLLNAIKSI